MHVGFLRMARRMICMGMLLWCTCMLTQAANLLTIREQTLDVRHVLDIQFSAAVDYHVFGLDHPARLVLDIQKGRDTFSGQKVKRTWTLVKNVRVHEREAQNLRIVLDLKQSLKTRINQKGRAQALQIEVLPKLYVKALKQGVADHQVTTVATRQVVPRVIVDTEPKEKRKVLPPSLRLGSKSKDMQHVSVRGVDYVAVPKRGTKSFSKVEFDRLVMLADYENNAVAQNTLGTLYYQGQQVARDYPLAVYWFERAASQDLEEAQHNLGIMYSKGLGVVRNYRHAAIWLRKAARGGQPKALYNLAILYLQGLGVPKRPEKAAKLLRRAARKDHAQAQYLLGVIYAQGTGVKKSFLYGYAWLEVAHQRGIIEADNIKKVIMPQMSAATIKKARALARRYVASYHEHRGEAEPASTMQPTP